MQPRPSPVGDSSVEVIEIDLGQGHTLFAEVSVTASGSGAVERRRDATAYPMRAVLDRTTNNVAALVRWVHAELSGLGTASPDRVSVELSARLTMENDGFVKAVVGRIGADASLLIRAEWDLAAARHPRATPEQRTAVSQ